MSTRARQWRDWALFALAASLPALAVGWIGLRALQGEEDATRREITQTLQAVAERTSRQAQDDVNAASAKLGQAALQGDPERISAQLDEIVPAFAQPLLLNARGEVLAPPPPPVKGPSAEASVESALAYCSDLATALASQSAEAEKRARFLSDCHEARTPTGRWLWPIVVLRGNDGKRASELAAWVEAHATSMGHTERAASLEDAKRAGWLTGKDRERVLHALVSTATLRESIQRTLRSEAAAAALRNGPDDTGWVRWRQDASWGVLRQLPSGELAGFLIHAPSLEAALRRGWPPLAQTYRASVRQGAAEHDDALHAVAVIAPSLSLRIHLKDPSLPAREAARGRAILVAVGLGSMLLAVAVAAVLFARMRAARRLSDLRTGFVSTVSHELRTPIASLRMLAELLEQDRVEPDEREEVHAALAREAKRLGDTVDRLLGFSRMAAGRYVVQKKEASIVNAVAASIDMFEERHKDHPPVERRLPEALEGDIDVGQLQLALDNLLGNAWKYAPEGAPYRVEVREERDGWVAIEVADHGPGIPRRDRKRVLQAFERGDDRLSTEVQGSGIGLALVRHVAAAHGGVAEIDGEPGGGTCVRIRFPRRAS